MWKLWLAGFWSLGVALLPFLGFPPDAVQVMIVVSGICISVLTFWSVGAAKKKTG